jgi:hypothetical protein
MATANLLACSGRSGQAVAMNKLFFSAMLTIAIAGICSAQNSTPATMTAKGSGAPYLEGPVWTLTFIKTKAGLGDDYFRQITQTVKPVYEEEKKEKIILDYKILSGDSMGAADFNVVVMLEYSNMAALDGLREKTDPILEKVMGSEEQRRTMAVKRLDIREILGTKTMREITLK